jgi:hypothetical protein
MMNDGDDGDDDDDNYLNKVNNSVRKAPISKRINHKPTNE